ncbi:hypothetical protein Pmani_014280 [Petrolisthes manimaculis]|uniref:Uncharacterized protein n=1 Tax=Petrolisthes manimaculis TaxID=1843537 RepID=A0AAE1PU97_9EUCA|nr:hypothetical protein Pmani_014280 [Petrolisthes manimaculis]
MPEEGEPRDRTKDRRANMDRDGSGEEGGDRGRSARGECQGGVPGEGELRDRTKDGSASMDVEMSGEGWVDRGEGTKGQHQG